MWFILLLKQGAGCRAAGSIHIVIILNAFVHFLYTKLKDTRTNVSELQKIRKCVDIALRADQPEQMQSRTKRQEQER